MKTSSKRVLAAGALVAVTCTALFVAGRKKPRGEQSVDKEAMRKSQQGELDAVAMYDALADVVESERDAAVFRRLSADESGHARVFHYVSHLTLKPNPAKAILIPLLYRTIGRKTTYRLIARGEYSAAKKYEKLLYYPEVKRIQEDEKRHGDMVLALLQRD